MERIYSSAPVVGTWRLLSHFVRDASGRISYPLGPETTGCATFTPDGYVSVQFARARRQAFASGDLAAADIGELVAAIKTYGGYSGRYEVDERQCILILSIEVSLFPNWAGTQQERYYEIDGDRLLLSSPPRPFEGKLQVSYLSWQRASRSPEKPL